MCDYNNDSEIKISYNLTKTGFLRLAVIKITVSEMQ